MATASKPEITFTGDHTALTGTLPACLPARHSRPSPPPRRPPARSPPSSASFARRPAPTRPDSSRPSP